MSISRPVIIATDFAAPIWDRSLTRIKSTLQKVSGQEDIPVYDLKSLPTPAPKDQVIVIVTDSVNPSWRNGEIKEITDPLAQDNCLAVWSTFPERNLRGTGLGASKQLHVSSATPYCPTAQLTKKLWRPMPREVMSPNIAIPGITEDPRWLDAWMHMLEGKPGFVPAFELHVPDKDKEMPTREPAVPPTLDQKYNTFRGSDINAGRLLTLASASHLNVERLYELADENLPEGTDVAVPVALAYYSGFLVKSPDGYLDFIDGAREKFLKGCWIPDTMQVLRTSVQKDDKLNLINLLKDPKPKLKNVPADVSSRYLKVTSTILKRLGSGVEPLQKQVEKLAIEREEGKKPVAPLDR